MREDRYDTDYYWKEFEKSGAVGAYLLYSAVKKRQTSGENPAEE